MKHSPRRSPHPWRPGSLVNRAGCARRERALRAASLLCGFALVLTAMPGIARADLFGPISLASESASQQADYAHDPAISSDGRFVVFDGSFGGVKGVWRRDLQTQAVEPVAVADPADEGINAPNAALPSISANGRYVSFTTTTALAAGDQNKAPDVYVRDMNVPVYGCDAHAPLPGCDHEILACELTPPTACGPPPAGAFTLASAQNGSEVGLTYEPPSGSESQKSYEEKDVDYGSVAAGRSALSANGQEVVFVTTAISNLDGAATPALQVVLRNLETKTTQLVSVAYEPATGKPAVNSEGRQEPVSGVEGGFTYGAVFSPAVQPPPFSAPRAYALSPVIGASISGDGSTVAWMGQDVAEQVKTLPDETLYPGYAEPLWRRVADGPEAPTLPVTGGPDPLSPACIASGELAPVQPPSLADPCQGPFKTEPPAFGTSTQVEVDSVPQLSADGQTVAFLANAPLIADGGDFGQGVNERRSDLYVANMRAGLSRQAALLPLTEVASGDLNDPATTADVVDLGISPGGSQVAFTTQRTVFPLGSPAYVSAPAGVPGMVELFDVDLTDDTLTRVTQGYEGGPAEHPHPPTNPGLDPYKETDGALSPSFSENGAILAFSSTASNLVYGDGNTPPGDGSTTFDGSDAFVVSREIFTGTPPLQYVSPPPVNPLVTPAWMLGVTAVSRPNGSVVLSIDAPGSGALHAGVQAAVLVRGGAHTAIAARAHAKRRRAAALLATRTVATQNMLATGDGQEQLVLTLAPRYRALAGDRGGLSALATVTFTAPGQPILRRSVPVTFLRTTKPARRAARASLRHRPRSARRHSRRSPRR
jgi:hypothetical protein